MKALCPYCEKETDLEIVRCEEEAIVRGEKIRVNNEYLKCLECGGDFYDPKSPRDHLDEAYREYRRRHNMLQPEEIKNLRSEYGLTQGEISKLLGWGAATISRYENGALQDEAHDKQLQLITEPANLSLLLDKTPEALAPGKRERLIESLKEADFRSCSFDNFFNEHLGGYEASRLSGFKKLDLNKLYAAILYLCKGGITETALNKLLFYADFKHFKEYATSITGSRYAHLPYGFVLNDYALIFGALVRDGAIEEDEVFYRKYPYPVKILKTKIRPDLDIFEPSELKTLAEIKEHLGGWSAKKLTYFSHKEKGYVDTGDGEIIAYEYAKALQI